MHTLQVILTLMAFKCLDPSCMHLTRGNHEAKSLNKIYGFEGEVKAKFSLQMMEVFRCASLCAHSDLSTVWWLTVTRLAA